MFKPLSEQELLRKTVLSGYLVFAWAIILFLVLWPPNYLEIITNLVEPHTYPGWVISEVVGYAVLDVVTIIVSVYLGRLLYRTGSHLRINSLRLVAVSWFILTVASVVPIQFMYQYALDQVERYMSAINQGILVDMIVVPFGSTMVGPFITALIVIASFAFVITALDLTNRTGLAYFAIAAVTALVSAATAVLTWNRYVVTFSIGLATLVLGIAIVLFALGLRELAKGGGEERRLILKSRMRSS